MRWRLFIAAFLIGGGLAFSVLSPPSKPCTGDLGSDGFRRNLFRGVLPRVEGVRCD
jgi:hypothetical protein